MTCMCSYMYPVENGRQNRGGILHGYPFYYSILDSCIGEMHCCESGRYNTFMHDQFGKCDIIVGHLPGKISQMCIQFSEWIMSSWNDAMVTSIISYNLSYSRT